MEAEILILSNDEKIIGWLNPELVEITEYNDEEGLKSIEVIHPYHDDTGFKYNEWLVHGNKIWINETQDLDSCLYVINSDKRQETLTQSITVLAEEVLVELNNLNAIANTNPNGVSVTNSFLNTCFGALFTIGTTEIESKDIVKYTGTLTPLALLRKIEEDTDKYFIAEYKKNENTNIIHRYLHFKKEIGVIHSTPIEFGENTNDLDIIIQEDDTYTAMQPIISGGESGTSEDTNNLSKVINDYRNLNIVKGQSIPMIVIKNEDGSVTYGSNWYAPYDKPSGSFQVQSRDDTKSSYPYIRDKEASNNLHWKCGTLETSETDKYSLYNESAIKLMDKLEPNIEITVDLVDIRRLQGEEVTYNVGDTVFIRIPSNDNLYKACVTSTEKNPHTPSQSKLTIGNAVNRSYSSPSTHSRTGIDSQLSTASIYQNMNNLLLKKNVVNGGETFTATANVQQRRRITFPQAMDGTPSVLVSAHSPTRVVIVHVVARTDSYFEYDFLTNYTGNFAVYYSAIYK